MCIMKVNLSRTLCACRGDALLADLFLSGIGFELECVCWDPKDGDLNGF